MNVPCALRVGDVICEPRRSEGAHLGERGIRNRSLFEPRRPLDLERLGPLTGAQGQGSHVDSSRSERGAVANISLGSCGHLWHVRALTWGNGCHTASSCPTAFTVVPRCSPLNLVRLWCVLPDEHMFAAPWSGSAAHRSAGWCTGFARLGWSVVAPALSVLCASFEPPLVQEVA